MPTAAVETTAATRSSAAAVSPVSSTRWRRPARRRPATPAGSRRDEHVRRPGQGQRDRPRDLAGCSGPPSRGSPPPARRRGRRARRAGRARRPAGPAAGSPRVVARSTSARARRTRAEHLVAGAHRLVRVVAAAAVRAPPPGAERLPGRRGQVAGVGPRGTGPRQPADRRTTPGQGAAADRRHEPAGQPGGALGHCGTARVAEHPCRAPHREVLALGPAVAVGVDDLAAQVHQHLGDVDPHRADLEAGAAQAGGVGQGVGLLVHADALEQRVEDRADRARVDRAVGVAAGALVDRADVQAGRAADAAQRLPADLVGQDVGPAVVQQHDVHLLRPVTGGDPGPHRGVGVHPLAGARARQQLEEDVEVLPGRHELLDADDADQHLGQGQAHPPVALALDDDERARLGDREVGAGDGDLGAQELLAQVQPGRRGELASGSSVRPSGAGRPARPSGSRKISRTSERLRWIAGTRMWLGRSSPSWTISSARSVSHAAMPSAASASLRSISWVAIDLTLTTSSTPWPVAMRATTAQASSGVAGPVHDRPAGLQRGLELEQVLVQVGAGCGP